MATNTDECILLDKANQIYLFGWRGIIETFVFYIVFGGFFILIFTAIRVFYVKRKPHYNDWNISWIQFMYGDRAAEMLSYPSVIDLDKKEAYLPPELWPYADDPSKSAHIVLKGSTKKEAEEEHQEQLDNLGRERFWLWDYLCIPFANIRKHRGPYAAQYLICQQYLIYYLAIISVICNSILLPVNVIGSTLPGDSFERTTINALQSDSSLLWVHAVVTILLVILGVVMMKLYWNQLPICSPVCDERTVMLSNIEELMRNAKTLYRFFKRCFHSVKVTRITNTYDVSKLADLQAELKVAKEAVRYAQCFQKERGKALQVNPKCCCCPSDSVNAIDYYTKETDKYEKIIQDHTEEILSTPENVVFVQFENAEMAQRVLRHFERTMDRRALLHDFMTLENLCCCCCCCPSKGTQQVYSDWEARYAPVPEDIVWKNIIMNPNKACFFAYILTVLLILCVFFLSTPLIATNYLHLILSNIGISAEEAKPPKDKGAFFRWHMVDSLSLIIAILLDKYVPVLSIYIQRHLVPRMTKSSKDHRLLQTSYLVLFFIGFIAPSVGLLLIQMFTVYYSDKSTEVIHLYKCLFPSQNSAFFLKLIIVYTFFDLAYDLLRIGDLIYYFFNCLVYTRNEAEYSRAREMTFPYSFYFNYVNNFTNDLLIFSIVVIYAVACPLIAPVGLLYMVVKHYVDRYKIYYLYALPHRIPLAVHQTVLYIVLMSFFFLLLQMTAFLTTNGPWKLTLDPGNVVFMAFVLYSLFLLLFSWCLFNIFFGSTQTSNMVTSQRTSWRSSRKKSSRLRSSRKNTTQKHKNQNDTKRYSKKRSVSKK